jgi:DNA-binding CsgD family transcriptional regulator
MESAMEGEPYGNSSGQPGVCGATRLTPRQAQIVRLAAAGLSSKQIARSLGIAKRTVDGYFADARRRTGAKTRIELVTAAAMSQVAQPGADRARPTPYSASGHFGHGMRASRQLRDRIQAVILAYETGLVSPGHDPLPS